MTGSLTEAGFSYTIDWVTYGGQGSPPIDLLADPEHVSQVPELAQSGALVEMFRAWL